MLASRLAVKRILVFASDPTGSTVTRSAAGSIGLKADSSGCGKQLGDLLVGLL